MTTVTIILVLVAATGVYFYRRYKGKPSANQPPAWTNPTVPPPGRPDPPSKADL